MQEIAWNRRYYYRRNMRIEITKCKEIGKLLHIIFLFSIMHKNVFQRVVKSEKHQYKTQSA